MKTNPNSQSGLFNPRILLAFALCSVGTLLAMLSFAATPRGGFTSSVANSLSVLLSFDPLGGKLNLPTPVRGGPLPRPMPSVLSGTSGAVAPAAPAGTTWVLQPRQEPIRRVGPQLAYDGANGTVLLFGGYICQGASCFPVNDTWTFDGTAWHQQHPTTSPPARYLGTMTYDA